MKTLAVNPSTSFKALYLPQNANFTKKQQQLVDDIELKTSQKPFDATDFYIEPRKHDSVELFVIENNNNTESKNKKSVGVFNEDYPFEKDSYSLNKAVFWNNKSGTIASAILIGSVVTMLLALGSFIKNKPQVVQKVEQSIETIKDTLNNKSSHNTIDLLK